MCVRCGTGRIAWLAGIPRTRLKHPHKLRRIKAAMTVIDGR